MLRTIALKLDYVPSWQAWNFHLAEERFRYAVWGFKSGKSAAGAVELVRHAVAQPRSLNWVVAPTTLQYEVAVREIETILELFPEVVKSRTKRPHEVILKNRAKIQFKSADIPENLRGPNVDTMWIDEGAWLKPAAWTVLRARVAATMGEIFVTTTPRGRNWLWREVLDAGMPPDQDYGEWRNGRRYVSHYATWQFDWVDEEEIADLRRTTPKVEFDQEYGALFITDLNLVFRNIEECLTWEPPPQEIVGPNVIGVDLAKYQDFSVAIIMNGGGRVLDIEHWNQVSWTVQRPRLVTLAKKWGAAIALDVSNIGSVIKEDLEAEGVQVVDVDMNDSRAKNDIILRLQVAFEQRQIVLPDPKAPWAPDNAKKLVDELKAYECLLTRGGRLSYSAPKGLHDDLVTGLALANFARVQGYAGGAGQAAEVVISREEWAKMISRGPQDPSLKSTRSRIFGNVFGRKRRSSLGWESHGRFWGG